jgi:hypothetical protein
MVYRSRWIVAAAMAAILVSACGNPSATKPPAGRPDANDDVIIPPDAGTIVVIPPDAGIVVTRMLSVVGDPAPKVQFGGSVQLTALLVGTGVGGIANAPVTFSLSGDGALSSQTATTNAAGLATVTFTAPKAAGTAEVTASADKVETRNEANWLISIVQPRRDLILESPGSVSLNTRQPAKLMVKLQDHDSGLAVAGAKVTFSAVGSRQGVLLNGKSQDDDIETTGVDGMARITLSVNSVASEFNFSLQASEPYSNNLLFTVDVQTIDQASCTANSDCAAGYQCNGGLCVSMAQCQSNADCNSGYSCNGGQCVQTTCSSDGDCSAKHHCTNGKCVPDTSSGTTCTSDADCGSSEVCTNGKCVSSGCTQDTDCFPQVCDLASGTCVDVATVIYDVSGDWKAVQIFHVKELVGYYAPGVATALTDIDTAFGYLEAVVDCHVSQFVPGWMLAACSLVAGEDCGQAIDDTVCQTISTYVPDWAATVVHIGADVSKVINDFEVHSDMTITQPATTGGDKHSIKGVDDWQTAVFYWYTNDCPTPDPGDPPPQCALVELDITGADVHPAPSPFTGTVQDSTLHVDTHNINLKFGKLVMLLINTLIQSQTPYSDLDSAIEGFIDCGAINSWIQGVVADIVGQDVAQYIDLTGTCQSAVKTAVKSADAAITNLNADLPMALSGKAGIVLLPGNTSNVADRLAPGIWYTVFPNSGEDLAPVGEWYADR